MTTSDADTGLQTALFEFLVRYLADREQNAVRPRAHYQALFPRWQSEIGDRFDELESAVDTGDIADSDDAWLATSRHFGRFRVLHELGRGGQAVVYLAEDPTLHRRVAAKVLTGASALDSDRLARFKREAEVAARLEHPGICEVYDAGLEGGVPYIVMRHVEGETLAHRITHARETGAGAPGVDQIPAWLRLFESAAAALHAAHEVGVVHRDVKPANIMVDAGEQPVLLDFGLARDEESEVSMTRSGDFLGTPGYMSPEQVAGHPRPLDRRTDVYSLGAALYECLTGRPPFEAPTRAALFHAILHRDAPDARTANPAISRDLAVVLQTALARERDRRYQTARDLAGELAAVRERRPIRARPLSPFARALRWARRRPAAATLVVVVALGVPTLAGLVGYLLSTSRAVALGEETDRLNRAEKLVDDGFFRLLERRTGATEAFHSALALDPSDAFALCGLALTHLELYPDDNGDPHAALAELDERASDFAGDPEFTAMKAWLLRRAGDEAEAAALETQYEGRAAVRLFMEGLGHMGAALQGNLDAGDDAFDALFGALTLSKPPRLLIYVACVRAAGRSRVDDGILASLAEAMVRRWPDSPDAWRYFGGAYWDRDTEKAVHAYRRLLELTPDNHRARAWLAFHLNRAGQSKEALELLESTLEINPDYAIAYEYLGVVQMGRGELDHAVRAFERAVELDDTRSFTFANLAEALRRQGELDRAIAAAQQAVERSEHSVWGLFQLGLSHRERGNHNEAVKALEQAFALGGDYAEMRSRLHQLGIAQYRSGDHVRARETLENHIRYLDTQPKQTTVHTRRLAIAQAFLAMTHFRLGERDRAMTSLGQAREHMARLAKPGRVAVAVREAETLIRPP